MCVLAFEYNTHPRYALVFAGNRDEFYDRPTAPATFWDEAPHVLAGRDLQAGGTWMGVTRNGFWGVVTNVRAPDQHRETARSRGDLVSTYLVEEPDPETYARKVAQDRHQYNPFNLLVGTPTNLYYVSSQTQGVHPVSFGVHGLSNDRLDTPWPKVTAAKERLRRRIEDSVDPEALLDLLDDRQPFPAEALPDTGVGPQKEKQLSPLFIEGEEYGTRSSTVLLIETTGTITFVERSFDEGLSTTTRRFSFRASETAQ